jgi:pimeloyl-ACP methyl ester carboxylesterase
VRALLGALVVLAALAVAVLVAAFALQRRLLYFPDRTSAELELARASRLGLAPWRGPGGVLRGWRAPAGPEPRARALVLHGNAGSALDRIYYVAALAPLGVDVTLLEYPGYGARPGSPTLETLTDATLDAVDALEREGGPVWLVGESLGTGVAARAARLRSTIVRGLVLVTPFAELSAVARHHYPFLPAALLRDRFAPARDLAGSRAPIVLLVAGRDEVVTAEQGRLLFAAIPGPKRLVEQPNATHNGLDLSPELSFWPDAVRFLEEGGGP